jgi:hypothetical protein
MELNPTQAAASHLGNLPGFKDLRKWKDKPFESWAWLSWYCVCFKNIDQ